MIDIITYRIRIGQFSQKQPCQKKGLRRRGYSYKCSQTHSILTGVKTLVVLVLLFGLLSGNLHTTYYPRDGVQPGEEHGGGGKVAVVRIQGVGRHCPRGGEEHHGGEEADIAYTVRHYLRGGVQPCEEQHGVDHVSVAGIPGMGGDYWEYYFYIATGKKTTNNFIARYTNGNRGKKGIDNFHLNIRSLKFKVQEVKNIIKEFSPHIFGLSETELRKESVNEGDLKIPGYNILYPKSWSVHGYARVVVYVKKSFKYEQIVDLEDEKVQSVWLRGNFKNCKKIYFCHGYREHLASLPIQEQRDYLHKFLNQWESASEHNFPTEPNEVHVSLDMNIDTYRGRWLQSDYRLLSLSRLVQNACNTGNFSQLVKEPTRSMYNSVTETTDISCLDHIYCNRKFKCSTPVVTPFGDSDHDLLRYTRYSKEPPQSARTIRRRSYKGFVEEEFKNDISMISWSDLYACKDLDKAVDIFTRKFRQVLDIHAPWVIFQKRKNFSPWLTAEIKELMATRDKWKKTARDLAVIGNGTVSEEEKKAWKNYKILRNKVNNKKRYDETEFKKKKLEENIDCPDKTWRTAKNFMNWKGTGPPSQIEVDGQLVTKAKLIADHMNKFFISKVNTIRKGMQVVGWQLSSCREIMTGKTCRLGLHHVTQKQVNTLIHSLSRSRSLAIDELDNFSVKVAADLITKPLHHIVTLSIMQQRFPSQWKHSKVLPLHKKDSTLLAKNYRPVAILSPLSKILEKAVYEQLYKYFSVNKLLHPNVHGFRKHHSTQTALLQMYDRWVKAAARGQVSGAVLLDLSAAFDLVSPDILLRKLEIYGLKQDFLTWIKSYLCHRYQCVWIDHTMSESLQCEVGVPQGSNLGPLFFLLFVNDLPYVLDGSLEMYADDSTLIATGENIGRINETLTDSCQLVSRWMLSNKLKLNADKTHVMTLGTSQRLLQPGNQVNIIMDGISLQEDPERFETLLGCKIQANLKWHKQINSLMDKLKSRLAGLAHIKFILPFHTRRIISEGMFNSVLAYCLPLFGGCDMQEIKGLQILQNKAARIVTHSPPRTNRDRIYDQLCWLTVNQLIMYHTLLTVYRVRLTKEPEYLATFLCNDNRYNKIVTVNPKLTLNQKSFTARGACNWNGLPLRIRQLETISSFKKEVRAWIRREVPRFLD